MRRDRQWLWSFRAAVSGVALCAVFSMHTGARSQEKPMTLKKLTPEEQRVIVDKGTEPPFSGKYDRFDKKGTYVCKRCGTPLYRSGDKFDAGCGWPSFDHEIPGAVKRTPDPDGVRTEITCAHCGAHLGHVFVGEHLTAGNVRHCVNSISLDFVPAGQDVQTRRAYFAGGCFWGIEYMLQRVEGVVSTRVGYMGGHTAKPTYRQVYSGKTGHAETVEVEYDPTETSFETLARLFFEVHDPTELNRQGPDIGEQYRSAIFYADDGQKETARKLIAILRRKGYDIATELSPAGDFWVAEEYHQDYYERSGRRPYCHSYRKRF